MIEFIAFFLIAYIAIGIITTTMWYWFEGRHDFGLSTESLNAKIILFIVITIFWPAVLHDWMKETL